MEVTPNIRQAMMYAANVKLSRVLFYGTTTFDHYPLNVIAVLFVTGSLRHNILRTDKDYNSWATAALPNAVPNILDQC